MCRKKDEESRGTKITIFGFIVCPKNYLCLEVRAAL